MYIKDVKSIYMYVPLVVANTNWVFSCNLEACSYPLMSVWELSGERAAFLTEDNLSLMREAYVDFSWTCNFLSNALSYKIWSLYSPWEDWAESWEDQPSGLPETWSSILKDYVYNKTFSLTSLNAFLSLSLSVNSS